MKQLEVYICIHKRISDKVGIDRQMKRKYFFRILGELYHIPKQSRSLILDEMVELKMVEKINKSQIKVNESMIF